MSDEDIAATNRLSAHSLCAIFLGATSAVIAVAVEDAWLLAVASAIAAVFFWAKAPSQEKRIANRIAERAIAKHDECPDPLYTYVVSYGGRDYLEFANAQAARRFAVEMSETTGRELYCFEEFGGRKALVPTPMKAARWDPEARDWVIQWPLVTNAERGGLYRYRVFFGDNEREEFVNREAALRYVAEMTVDTEVYCQEGVFFEAQAWHRRRERVDRVCYHEEFFWPGLGLLPNRVYRWDPPANDWSKQWPPEPDATEAVLDAAIKIVQEEKMLIYAAVHSSS